MSVLEGLIRTAEKSDENIFRESEGHYVLVQKTGFV